MKILVNIPVNTPVNTRRFSGNGRGRVACHPAGTIYVILVIYDDNPLSNLIKTNRVNGLAFHDPVNLNGASLRIQVVLVDQTYSADLFTRLVR